MTRPEAVPIRIPGVATVKALVMASVPVVRRGENPVIKTEHEQPRATFGDSNFYSMSQLIGDPLANSGPPLESRCHSEVGTPDGEPGWRSPAVRILG